MRRLAMFVLVLAGIIMFPLLVQAQDAGYISGQVTTILGVGNLLPGARSEISLLGISDTSDYFGRYFLGDIPPGTYDICFSYRGFDTLVVADFAVTEGDTAILDVRLSYDTRNYTIIYGNRDASPMPAVIGEILEIPVWGATTPGNFLDSVAFMHLPLASNDLYIQERLGIEVHDNFVGRWDEVNVLPPESDTVPGWTNQSLEAFAWTTGPPNPQNYFWTGGDTISICTFFARAASDSSVIGDTLSLFKEGYIMRDGPLIWGMQDGTIGAFPVDSYSQVYFLLPSEIGYISGMIADSTYTPFEDLTVTVLDVNKVTQTDYMGRYLLGWILPGQYDLWFYKENVVDTVIQNVTVNPSDTTVIDLVINRRCNYIPGDIGGNGTTNGIDVGYGVNYLKGGPAPPWYCDMCPQTPPFYASGDVNGNCVFNGIDIAYFVNYLKGVVPALLYCPSCPPSPW